MCDGRVTSIPGDCHMTDTTTHQGGPGRLGDPASSPATDPRIDRRLRAMLAALQLDGLGEPAPLDRTAGLEAIGEFIAAADAGFSGLYEVIPLGVDGDEELSYEEQVITADDGHELTLRIFRPAGVAAGPLPAVLYIHGGGMTILPTDSPVHLRWCQSLASSGVIAISVDFRNAWTAAGHNPFPRGLNDCATGLDWVHEHRDELGISRITVQGESGGGNLTLATALKAKREGRLDAIDGVYASVPYISGGYHWSAERKRAELPSLVENDGYFIACDLMEPLAHYYGPEADHQEDPLAWPYFASVDELAGLPPHVISVNELDPLRDEGSAYYRNLLAAGVEVTGRVNLGITHGAELICRNTIPDVSAAAITDISRFARGG